MKFLIAVVNYSHVMNKTITLKAKKKTKTKTNKQNKTKQNKTTVTSNKYDKKSMVF